MEKQLKKGQVWIYTLSQVPVVGTYQGITEIPRVMGEQVVIDFETTGTQILYYKYSRCSRIPFTERVILPQ